MSEINSVLFIHGPNKAFLVPDSCRANSKKRIQYKCGRDKRTHLKMNKTTLVSALLIKI